MANSRDNAYRELVRLLTQAGEWAEEGRALPFDLALMLRAKADGLMAELGEAADVLRSDLLRRGREYLVEHCSLRRLCPEAYRAFEECREAEGVFTDRAGRVYFWRVGKAHEEPGGREHWVLEVRTAGGECLGPLGPTTGRAYWGVKVVAKGRG